MSHNKLCTVDDDNKTSGTSFLQGLRSYNLCIKPNKCLYNKEELYILHTQTLDSADLL